MYSALQARGSGKKRQAFTLVELLVVIGIIALLISILLPSLNKARQQAQVVQCAANLHNLGLSMISYAADNKGALPQYLARYPGGPAANAGGWLWDLEVQTRNALCRYGMSRKLFYCPSNYDAMATNVLWNYQVYVGNVNIGQGSTNKGVDPATGKSYDSHPFPDESGYSVLGYPMLIYRPNGMYQGNSIYNTPLIAGVGSDPVGGYPNPQINPVWFQPLKWDYQKSLKPKNRPSYAVSVPGSPLYQWTRPNSASTNEIAFDAVISTTSNGPYVWGNVVGGYPTSHQSSHWYRQSQAPVGSNILFLDGHVEWRSFKVVGVSNYQGLKPRGQIAGGSMVFWW